ncbi:alpha/beta fold hydrolase [Brachybacterium sp. MASK1Z-5]|uniref:Alpha/beta fold hydrolase n=1 Tax=Brachybacterium halotolerans TaxID=2795215 RepID=A0ABS1B9Q6_9MICO|nr:alpha/beta hydrolase [Brachybacterium halotolerans]MBK0331385.1 alpha/beta fold hydrolase [Brachybacterium halotolerans]
MNPTTRRLVLADQTIAHLDIPPSSPETGGRDPLVLLHGGAVDHRMWGPQLGAFPDRRLIVPDARGHGGSSDAEGPYRLADDVVALLDALDIERAVLVGISMGGGTAVDVALEHPGRASALVVSGTGTSEPTFTDPWCLDVFQRWQAAEAAGDLETWIAVFSEFTAGPQRGRSDVDPAVVDLVETMARETVAHHLRVDANGTPIAPIPFSPVTGTWERVGRIEIPVLALCGALDGTDHRAMGERLAASVPEGEYVEIPGVAHYPNLERPDRFDVAVAEFLATRGV